MVTREPFSTQVIKLPQPSRPRRRGPQELDAGPNDGQAEQRQRHLNEDDASLPPVHLTIRDQQAVELGLTERQEIAARFFANGVSAKLSAISAGYPTRGAYEVLTTPRVHAYLEYMGRRLDLSVREDVELGIADRAALLASMSEICLDRQQAPQARAMAGKIILEHYERCGMDSDQFDSPPTMQEGIVEAYKRLGGPRPIPESRQEMIASNPDYVPVVAIPGDTGDRAGDDNG